MDDAVAELAVMGASHQVAARIGGATCIEAVTCDGRGVAPLPGATALDLPGLRYTFSSAVEQLDRQAFTRRARRLRGDLASDPRALVAAFPGHADALTGLLAHAVGGAVVWRSWHAYPLTGELVWTTTRLAPR